MSKEKLKQRLGWYYPTERFNVFLFSGIILYILINYSIIDTLFLVYGLFVMTYILYQGQRYWKLKLYKLTNKYFDEQKNITFFKRAKKINTYLILSIPVVFLIQLLLCKMNINSINLISFSIAANSFAILEHINYYYRQLMIDNIADINYIKQNKRLKTSSLAKDLRENKI